MKLTALLLAVSCWPLAVCSAGDPERGSEIYQRCKACHALAYDRTGPRHCGLLGRPAGSVAGFSYSSALRASGIVWDRVSLDAFLQNPLATVPGTTMGYAGITDAGERADLIEYLAQIDRTAACR